LACGSSTAAAPPRARISPTGVLYSLESHCNRSGEIHIDCFRILAWLTLATIPLLFAIRHFKPAVQPPAGH